MCVRVFVSERKKETKKKRRKEPTRERERESGEVFLSLSLSLLLPFPEESEKDDDASDKRRTRRRCFYFSPSFHTPRARWRVFIYAKAARRLDFFFPLYPKRERRCIFFQIAREKEPERERERETIERARETRTRATHRKETTASMGPLRSPLKSPCLCVFVLYLSVFWHFFFVRLSRVKRKEKKMWEFCSK